MSVELYKRTEKRSHCKISGEVIASAVDTSIEHTCYREWMSLLPEALQRDRSMITHK